MKKRCNQSKLRAFSRTLVKILIILKYSQNLLFALLVLIKKDLIIKINNKLSRQLRNE